MKIRQFQIFLAVHQEGGIRAAGRALHLSQSAVARTITQLEESLQCRLLSPGVHGRLTLTPEGKAFLPYARAVVEQMHRAEEAINQLRGGDVGTVRFAITPYLPGDIVSRGLNLFRKRFRNVRVEIRDGIYSAALPNLKSGEMDFCVTLITDNLAWPDNSVATTRLFSVNQGLAAHRNHPIFASNDPLDVSRYEWIITAENEAAARQRIAETFVKNGLPWPARVTVCDQQIHDAMLRSDKCKWIAVTPFALDELNTGGTLRRVEFAGHPRAGMLKLPPLIGTLMKRSNVPMSPAAQYMEDCMCFVIREWCEKSPQFVLDNASALILP